jgi:hypothetical protein
MAVLKLNGLARAALLALGLLIVSCEPAHSPASHTGVFPSDPHLVGARDSNYDHLIVPGERIGPVRVGDAVINAIQHLGEPYDVNRRNHNRSVDYYYDDECISFEWQDAGITPTISANVRAGIDVTCNKWRTADGLHVGSSLQDVVSRFPSYCLWKEDDGSLLIITNEGIVFAAKDRNSPVNDISVVTTTTDWKKGFCPN